MSGHAINAFCGVIVCFMFFVWFMVLLFVLNKFRKRLMRKKRRYIYDTLEVNIG